MGDGEIALPAGIAGIGRGEAALGAEEGRRSPANRAAVERAIAAGAPCQPSGRAIDFNSIG